jgi:hypothetical protein
VFVNLGTRGAGTKRFGFVWLHSFAFVSNHIFEERECFCHTTTYQKVCSHDICIIF